MALRRVRGDEDGLHLQAREAPLRLDAARLSRQRWALFSAAALFAWLSLLGAFFYVDPDEGAYKAVAVGIADGRWPYRDFFINRQPVLFFWYLPSGFGAPMLAQRLIAAAATAASVPVLGAVAGRWLPERRARVAVVCYALFLANPLMPVRANTEAFMLLPLVASVAVASPFAAGALFGVAVMTKLHAAVFAPVLIVIWKRQAWRPAIAATAVAVLLSLPFAPVWREYLDANVWFNFDYARYSSDGRLAALLSLDEWVLVGALPLWIAAVVGAIRARHTALLVWAACGVVSVKASGLEFNHYYALLTPPAALLAAVGLSEVRAEMRGSGSWRSDVRAWVPGVAIGASAIVSVSIALAAAATIVFRTGDAPSESIAAAARRHEGELLVLGDRTEIYEYAGRWPERRFFSSIPLVMRASWGEEMRHDVLACPPAVLVVQTKGDFLVPWAPEAAALYRVREVFGRGVVYSEPVAVC